VCRLPGDTQFPGSVDVSETTYMSTSAYTAEILLPRAKASRTSRCLVPHSGRLLNNIDQRLPGTGGNNLHVHLGRVACEAKVEHLGDVGVYMSPPTAAGAVGYFACPTGRRLRKCRTCPPLASNSNVFRC
jgi:hypothetical protein